MKTQCGESTMKEKFSILRHCNEVAVPIVVFLTSNQASP